MAANPDLPKHFYALVFAPSATRWHLDPACPSLRGRTPQRISVHTRLDPSMQYVGPWFIEHQPGCARCVPPATLAALVAYLHDQEAVDRANSSAAFEARQAQLRSNLGE